MLSGCKGNAALSALNGVTPNSGYTLTDDVPFGSGSRQTMDIYQPEAASEESQVIVFVYGGAWREGIKEDYAFVANSFAKQGHWVVIPDYRLFPEARFPEFVDDVAASITALPQELKKITGESYNPLNIVLMGHSSGAHTAALIAADSAWLEGSSVQVDKLIAMSGPYDLPLDNPEVRPVFAKALDTDDALPIKKVGEQHPSTLLIHGSVDKRVLPKHTERYSAALKSAGIDTTVLWIDDAGHAGPVKGLSDVLPDNGVFSAVTQFLTD